MPAHERSLRLTDLYRARLLTLRERAEGVAADGWREVSLADFEPSFTDWLGKTATAVTDAQVRGVRLTAAYLTAFLSSELGRRVPTVTLDARAYAGTARDGRPLAEAYDTARIAVLVALKEGKSNDEALAAGSVRALRAVELDVMQTARQSLQDAQRDHPLVVGYNRAVSGTCGACVAASDGEYSDTDDFESHPGCQCVPEPRVRGVSDTAPRLLGAQLFASMSKAEQDDALGEEAAELVRNGLPLRELIKRNRMATEPSFITQKPVRALDT